MSRKDWKGIRGVKFTVIIPTKDKRFVQAVLNLPSTVTEDSIDSLIETIKEKATEYIASVAVEEEEEVELVV